MHGGNLRKAREDYGIESFVDLSANINPFGPPAGVWEVLQKTLKEIVHYPDPESQELRLELSRHTQLPMQNIIVGNGAGELLFTIMQALKPRKILIPIPAFSEYERAAKAAGAEVNYLKLGAQGWNVLPELCTFDDKKKFIEAWHQTLQGCDLLVLCSPHNPTGTVLSQEHFKLILGVAHELNCRIIFDESFVDFLPDAERWSARTLVMDYPNLIVLYSMTKFYSLPGLRLGAAFAEAGQIERFRQYRDPWTVNVLAEQAGIAALKDREYPGRVRQEIWKSKEFFYREFQNCSFKNLRLRPTAVNFALFEVLDRPAGNLVQTLGRQGILVRDCTNFDGLEGEFIRVAIKDVSSMEKLLEGLVNL